MTDTKAPAREFTLFYSGLSGQAHIHSAKQSQNNEDDEYIDVIEASALKALEDDYKCLMAMSNSLRETLSIAIDENARLRELLRQIRPAFEIVCAHYLAHEEQASVIGVSMCREDAERVRAFWDASNAFDKALSGGAE